MVDSVSERTSDADTQSEVSDQDAEPLPAERRRHTRSDSFYPVRLHVERLGAEAVLRHGILLNVSRGGALLSVDGYLPRDQPCEVEIYGAAGRVIPHRIFSRVVETSIGPGEGFRMRVEFSTPLEIITRPDEI